MTRSNSASAVSEMSSVPSRKISHSSPDRIAQRQTRLVQLAHALCEGNDARLIEPIRHSERLRVVRDRDVLVTQCGCRFGHLFERSLSIRFGRVHVQVAANLGLFDQMWERAVQRGFQFAAILTQFGRNPRVAQPLINFRFGCARHPLVGFNREQAVLIQSKALPHGVGADGDVMFLAAGEILHGGAEAFSGQARAHLLEAARAHRRHLLYLLRGREFPGTSDV